MLLVHSCNKYLLSSFYVQMSVPCAGNGEVNITTAAPALQSIGALGKTDVK